MKSLGLLGTSLEAHGDRVSHPHHRAPQGEGLSKDDLEDREWS